MVSTLFNIKERRNALIFGVEVDKNNPEQTYDLMEEINAIACHESFHYSENDNNNISVILYETAEDRKLLIEKLRSYGIENVIVGKVAPEYRICFGRTLNPCCDIGESKKINKIGFDIVTEDYTENELPGACAGTNGLPNGFPYRVTLSTFNDFCKGKISFIPDGANTVLLVRDINVYDENNKCLESFGPIVAAIHYVA